MIFLAVYLRIPPSSAYQRLRTRGRTEEQCVPLQLLENLHTCHENLLVHRTLETMLSPVIIIDGLQSFADIRSLCVAISNDLTNVRICIVLNDSCVSRIFRFVHILIRVCNYHDFISCVTFILHFSFFDRFFLWITRTLWIMPLPCYITLISLTEPSLFMVITILASTDT